MNTMLRRREMMMAGSAHLPYTPVDYIETDGVAYIDTSLSGAEPLSSEYKFMLPSSVSCCVMGRGEIHTTSRMGYTLCHLVIYQNKVSYVHAYLYSNNTHLDISTLIQNQEPFLCKTQTKVGDQLIQAKSVDAAQWTSRSSTQADSIRTGSNIFLFRTSEGSDPWQCPTGSRLYYAKIYGDYDFGTLVFDGVPCYYNGEYGLWDNITNTFFGNSAGSGAFTGPVV